jgi:chromosome partitioning protein
MSASLACAARRLLRFLFQSGASVRSIVLANQKGGVGKTTTAIHLAHGFALAGRKVVLMDLDPQGNATVAVQGMEHDAHGAGILESLSALSEHLWLIGAPEAKTARPGIASVDLLALRRVVAQVGEVADFLVIDCPPRMDEWGWAGVQLCDEVIVPVQAEFFAMHGLSQMLGSLEAAAAEFPGRARLRGVLPTMVDYTEPVHQEILDDLRKNLGSSLLRTVVLRDAGLVEAASFGRSIFQHSPFSKGSLCYAELVKELIDG